MPKGTTLEKLTFRDVLDVSDNIVANADALKVGSVFKAVLHFYLIVAQLCCKARIV